MTVEPLPVSVLDVRKVYGSGDMQTIALDGVSLDVKPGEMVALVGPSGCGKSTLLNLIGCIDLPTSGAVRIGGAATSALNDDELTRLRRERIGTVFQFFNLLPTMTAAENVALPLVLARAARRETAQRVESALRAVGLTEKARAYPAQLSGGQMQRVAIARALIHEPAIILADEPTGNLDTENGDAILQLLRSFALKGQAILMATHASTAASICDRIVQMRDGRIVA